MPWNPFKSIGKAISSAAGGLLDSATFGLGNKVVEQVTGKGLDEWAGGVQKKATEALAPPKNPYQVELENNARELRGQGSNLTALVTPQLNDAITGQISALKDTSDLDRLANMIIGEGITGNEAAFQRSKANTEASFTRRGVGGGVAAGARALLEGKKIGGQNMALQSGQKFRITETQRRKDALTRLLMGLMDAGQADSLRADNLLYGLGGAEAQRLGQGQQNAATIAQQIAAEIARGSAGKSKAPTTLMQGDGYLVGGESPRRDFSTLPAPEFLYEPQDMPISGVAGPVRRPLTMDSLAGELYTEDVPALLKRPAQKSIWG